MLIELKDLRDIITDDIIASATKVDLLNAIDTINLYFSRAHTYSETDILEFYIDFIDTLVNKLNNFTPMLYEHMSFKEFNSEDTVDMLLKNKYKDLITKIIGAENELPNNCYSLRYVLMSKFVDTLTDFEDTEQVISLLHDFMVTNWLSSKPYFFVFASNKPIGNYTDDDFDYDIYYVSSQYGIPLALLHDLRSFKYRYVYTVYRNPADYLSDSTTNVVYRLNSVIDNLLISNKKRASKFIPSTLIDNYPALSALALALKSNGFNVHIIYDLDSFLKFIDYISKEKHIEIPATNSRKRIRSILKKLEKNEQAELLVFENIDMVLSALYTYVKHSKLGAIYDMLLRILRRHDTIYYALVPNSKFIQNFDIMDIPYNKDIVLLV